MTNPPNPIERVARAICRSLFSQALAGTPQLELLDEIVDKTWRNHIPEARSAIEAMREPTEAEAEAGVLALRARDYELWERNTPEALREFVTAIHQAMISEALK